MEDLNQSGQQMPVQTTERPTAVTVFGILSIVFGSMGVVCTPIVLLLPLLRPETMETTDAYKVWEIVGGFAGIGLSIWLLTTGIGLLKLKRWARRSAIIYACVNIPWIIFATGMSIAAFSLNWVKMPEGSQAGQIGGICGGICGSLAGLIFPILLLIFMQTAKVKQAFAQIESGQVLQQ